MYKEEVEVGDSSKKVKLLLGLMSGVLDSSSNSFSLVIWSLARLITCLNLFILGLGISTLPKQEKLKKKQGVNEMKKHNVRKTDCYQYIHK